MNAGKISGRNRRGAFDHGKACVPTEHPASLRVSSEQLVSSEQITSRLKSTYTPERHLDKQPPEQLVGLLDQWQFLPDERSPV